MFLGYEPNAIPYRVFWPLLKVAAKIVPEHRDRDRIRERSGQRDHPSLKDVDIHELSEFHIFHGTRGGRGIHPFDAHGNDAPSLKRRGYSTSTNSLG